MVAVHSRAASAILTPWRVNRRRAVGCYRAAAMSTDAARVSPLSACQALWAPAGLDAASGPAVDLPVSALALPTSFAIATALQASLGAAAAAASVVGQRRAGPAQRVQVAAGRWT